MALKLIDIKPHSALFEVTGISSSQANALRRTFINDIPKLAIDKIMFHHGQIRDMDGNVYDSSLPLFDEVVAHRIGLIPLKTDLKMNFRSECSCGGKGCPLCTVTYSINKLGPATVTSGDLQPVGNPDLVPADKEIPIVKLGKKQAILLTAEAILGRGSEHAKWQATSGVSYKYHREAEIIKSKVPEWKVMKEKNPEAVISETKDKIKFTDDFKTRLFSPIIGKDGVNISEDSNRFIFRFESDGSLEVNEIISYALSRIPERLNILHESIISAD